MLKISKDGVSVIAVLDNGYPTLSACPIATLTSSRNSIR